MFNHARRSLPLAVTFSFKFNQYQRLSLSSFSHSDLNLLSLCSSTQSLLQTKQAHAVAILHGSLPYSVSLSASLILRYASFGDPCTSLILFQQSLPYSRSAFLWNSVIRARSIAAIYDGFEVYNTMIRNGVSPDDHTFPFVLKVCSDFSQVRKGKEIHGSVFKLSFDDDVYVGNTLLQFYGNCGALGDARKVFDEMIERDVVSWNTVIAVYSVNGFYAEACDLFLDMKLSSRCMPNLVSIVSVLPVCAGLEDTPMVSDVHCYIVKVGLDSQVMISNALVDAYGKCGALGASKQVFYEMQERNVVSWNAIIISLAYRKQYHEAFDMFRVMIIAKENPNSITISSILPVLVELEHFDVAKEVHGFSVRMGMDSDIFIANSLIDMYAKSGRSTEASIVFHSLNSWNVVSWNAMIANCAQNRLESDAIELLRQMQEYGEFPNSVTFTNILPACARMGFLLQGKEIHAKSMREGSAFELFVSNALTDMYAKCGCLEHAQSVFDISMKDVISYNILIVGYSQTSDCSESISLFSKMGLLGMSHDVVSFVGVLSACANLAAVKHGKEIHGYIVRKLFHSHLCLELAFGFLLNVEGLI